MSVEMDQPGGVAGVVSDGVRRRWNNIRMVEGTVCMASWECGFEPHDYREPVVALHWNGKRIILFLRFINEQVFAR